MTLISDVAELQETLGKPGQTNYQDFFSAYSFLAYSKALKLVRVTDNTALNAANTAGGPVKIDNKAVFNLVNLSDAAFAGTDFIAKYPGAKGNALRVIAVDSTTFAALPTNLRSLFPSAPNTSKYAYDLAYELASGSQSARAAIANSVLDEMHVIVVDVTGEFSGIPGSVLETFPFLSKAVDGRDSDNAAKYFKSYINENSRFVWATGTIGANDVSVPVASNGVVHSFTVFSALVDQSFAGGDDGGVPLASDYIEGWNEFEDPESVSAQLLYVGEAGGHKTVVYQHIVDNVIPKRPDSVICVAVRRDDVVGKTQTDGITGCNSFVTAVARSTSYGIMTSGWKEMFDPFTDRYIQLPCDADVAGLMAYTDEVAASFYSPAGLNRGLIRNMTALLWNPRSAARGELDAIRVNPVISSKDGFVLFGDRTAYVKESVFSFINVRRLFNLLKTVISEAARYSLFEFNDEFTQRQFVVTIDPILSQTKSKRGLTDYKIVCDATNNTKDVIDAGDFVGEVLVKPARTIQRVRLIFTAVRQSVSFEEVVG